LVLPTFSARSTSRKQKNCAQPATDAAILRENAEQYRIKKESELKGREAAIAAVQAKLTERDGKTVASEEQLAKILNEREALETKLQAKEAEISTLQKQIEEKQPASANPGAPSTVELQARLDDARQQLDNAEREKSLLSEKIQAIRERSSQLEDEQKRREVARGKVRRPRHDFGRQPSL